jgi:hypothetical protein
MEDDMDEEKPFPHGLFREVCELIWGPSWVGAGAREMEINERTVKRWKAEEFNIPGGVRDKLVKACRSHAVRLTKMADKLERLSL